MVGTFKCKQIGSRVGVPAPPATEGRHGSRKPILHRACYCNTKKYHVDIKLPVILYKLKTNGVILY